VIFVIAISIASRHLVEFIFINDTDLEEGNLHRTNDIFEEICKRAQRVIDQWEGSLNATGGVL